ncbi:unnamed protein product [Amoebophrya sp. A120]|nr:unnamed protein product [Amoebophrya sp. A120]|eukprot:GSA120T00015446001.1
MMAMMMMMMMMMQRNDGKEKSRRVIPACSKPQAPGKQKSVSCCVVFPVLPPSSRLSRLCVVLFSCVSCFG